MNAKPSYHLRTGCLLPIAVVLTLVAVPLRPAAAQQSPPGKEEVEKLNFLLGRWSLEVRHEPAPGVKEEGHGNGAGRITAVPGPGGLHILMDVELDEPGRKFSIHEIFTWDARDMAYKNFAVNNAMPGGVTHTGKWEGQDLVFEAKLGGFTSRRVWSGITRDAYTYAFLGGAGGQPLRKVLTIVAKRAAEK